MEWFVLDELLDAEAQLLDGRRDIARQLDLIARLERQGRDVREEREILDDLERSQELVERSYRQLVEHSKSLAGDTIDRPA